MGSPLLPISATSAGDNWEFGPTDITVGGTTRLLANGFCERQCKSAQT